MLTLGLTSGCLTLTVGINALQHSYFLFYTWQPYRRRTVAKGTTLHTYFKHRSVLGRPYTLPMSVSQPIYFKI